MKPEFKQLLQLGIIVRDVEAAVKNYMELGIGPWETYDMASDKEPFNDMTFDGKPIAEKGPVLKIAMLHRFGFEIELIEPVAGTVYKEWLDEHGPGLHHVAFALEDSYPQFVEKCKAKNGKEPWVRGQGLQGTMDFSYMDMREELGLIIECYGEAQPGKPALDYDLTASVTGQEESKL